MEHQARNAELAERYCPASTSTTPVTNVTNTASSSSSSSFGRDSNSSTNSSNSTTNNMTPPVLPIEMGSPPKFPSQRPYKYGMIMLCLGALINWLGLAENYIEPVRYVGVACIVTGAMLIIAAMCCWMNSNTPTPPNYDQNGVHVIDINDNNSICTSKPPDYETIIQAPPSYDAAIKLNPASLIHLPTTSIHSTETTVSIPVENLSLPPSYDETTQQQQPQQQSQQQQQQQMKSISNGISKTLPRQIVSPEKAKNNNHTTTTTTTTTTTLDMKRMRKQDALVDRVRNVKEAKEKEKECANGWNCNACTYLNKPGVEICVICGKSKNNVEVVMAVGGSQCPVCTLVNKRDVANCEACATSLKNSPTYI